MIPRKRPAEWSPEDRNHDHSHKLSLSDILQTNEAPRSSQPLTLRANTPAHEVYSSATLDEDFQRCPLKNGGLAKNLSQLETSSEVHTESIDEQKKQQDNRSPKEASEGTICFGMIHDARIKIHEKAPSFLNEEGAPLATSGLYHFELVFQARYFILQSPLVGSVAVLNEQTGRTLKEVTELHPISLGAYCSVDKWNTWSRNMTKSAKDAYMLVDINVYGPEEVRDVVGQLLSSSHLYLQRPSYLDGGTFYDNPHFLKIPGIAPDFGTIDREALHADATTESEVSTTSTRIHIDETMSAIFDSLTRFKCLEEVEADARIKTSLLPHQKRALDFLAQREFGPVPDNYSLWERSTENDRNIYKNKIDGVKTSKLPLETGGGILADDMGLGKTLTILAAISRTLRQAQIFVEQSWIEFKRSWQSSGNARVPSRSSLVIVPTPLLLEEWRREIHRHLHNGLKVTTYHGRGREVDPLLLADSDIVLSTYHTVATEALDPDSALFQVVWFRIVLDEAHIIRNMSTKLFRAVSELSAHLRWCLTGTPIQNRLEDMGSLLAFLRIAPFSDLHEFQRHIIAPITNSNGWETHNFRLLLDSVCLRRTNVLLNLPSLVTTIRRPRFTDQERELYDTTQKEMARAMKEQIMAGKPSKSWLGHCQLQQRLRRICNHGTFANSSHHNAEAHNRIDPQEAIAILKNTIDARCVYCELEVSRMIGSKVTRKGYLTVCGHLLCSTCVPRFERELKDSELGSGLQCSLCSQTLTKQFLLEPRPRSKMGDKLLDNTGPNAADFNDDGISTKVSTMIGDIEGNLQNGKSIVFSCWTRSLDLVEKLFTLRRIHYARLDGSHSTYQRQATLDDFDSDPNIRVLIMTTGTGAVGLNLTMARFVYMLEPQWNPTVEEQAIARVLRLGQREEVKVVRYVMEGTLEEGMRNLQLKKVKLANILMKHD